MYPDRGTHVSRPRYAHFTTEMSIHHDQDEHTRRPKCGDQAAPTTYPEARVGEHISWSHLAIVGAIVHGVSFSVNLVEAAWEQHRAVEA